MVLKSSIRKKYFLKRKKKYFDIENKFFFPIKNLLKKNNSSKKLSIALYYPISFEVNILKIVNIENFKNFNFLLPVVEKKGLMNFYSWKKNDILLLNKYGIPEPIKSKPIVPDIMFLPLLSFDRFKNRLGYGKGYYDKYLNKHYLKKKKIFTVGVAFSFQKYNKLPINNRDFKLDLIITEKGIL
tara:strand:+ start:68 stop:619 length:552 start_codon:yes stop_codon:yes gene_type:complete